MKIRNYLYSVPLIIVTIPGIVGGQSLSIKTILDTNSITIGDQVGLHYIIEKNEDINLSYPVSGEGFSEGIEIIGLAQIDSITLRNKQIRVAIDYLLTVFDTGLYYIPPQPFIFNDGPFTDTAYSSASYIAVSGVQLDEGSTIRDIKEPIGAPVSPLLILAMVVLTPFLIGLVGYGIYALFFRKKEVLDLPEKRLKPEEPYYIVALRELDRIKAQKLWQQKQLKEYYTRITYIVRWFIGKSFSIPALEETTEEILDHIRRQDLDQVNYHHLEKLLNLADLVKFAKGEPDPDENIMHLDNAYSFVKTIRNSEVYYEMEKTEQLKTK